MIHEYQQLHIFGSCQQLVKKMRDITTNYQNIMSYEITKKLRL
jgi:hypothetical protein